MKRKITGYLIEVPDKNNPKKIRYYHVTGPRFMYGKSIIKEFYDDGTEVSVREKKVDSKTENIEPKKTDIKKDDLVQDDEKVRQEIASEVSRILHSKKENETSSKPKEKKNSSPKKSTKRKISRPKKEPEYFEIRYTMPKERGVLARIINQIKYENGWYEDIEDYLNDEENFVWDELEWSKNAEKRREQRFYKRVQAYEDADNDVAMKKAFLAVKIGAVVAMLATLGFSVNLLYNEVHDIIYNNSYVAQAQEKSTLANANTGQIEYAERVLAKIEYDFKYLSHTELLDTVIRVGSEPSKITENRAMATMKNAGEFADQKLLEEIVQEAYEGEYEGFGSEKKQELNQLVYEMLDENVKMWIRSPEKVAILKENNNIDTQETNEVGSER